MTTAATSKYSPPEAAMPSMPSIPGGWSVIRGSAKSCQAEKT